jgi:proteasome lid subunit RPN8/RPN11
MSILRLPRAVYHDLRAHGEEAWPHEACGALLGRAMQEGGPGWQVDCLVRAVNIRASTSAGSSLDRYEIAPAELVGIVREASNRGLEIAGFYHSHPGHPAQPSVTDSAEAHWIGCSYVITEIAQGKAALTSAFLLAGTAENDKHFEPQVIQIVETLSEIERA